MRLLPWSAAAMLVLCAALVTPAVAAVRVSVQVGRSPADKYNSAEVGALARVEAIDGGGDDVGWSEDAHTLTVQDTRGVIAGEGCVASGDNVATCALPTEATRPLQLDVTLGAGSDRLVADPGSAQTLVVQAGAGDDVVDLTRLTGRGLPDFSLWGGSVLVTAGLRVDGGPGDDKLLGGPETDVLVGGPGADTIDGGDGIDAVSYAAAAGGVEVSLSTGRTGDDGDGSSDALRDVEAVVGSDRDDVLIGSPKDDLLYGGRGADDIAGLEGDDVLSGDSGLAGAPLDGAPDRLDGGPGSDRLSAGLGHDLLIGGDGDDRLRGWGAAIGVTTRCGAGNDQVAGLYDSWLAADCERFAVESDSENGVTVTRAGPWAFALDGRCQADLLLPACRTTVELRAVARRPHQRRPVLAQAMMVARYGATATMRLAVPPPLRARLQGRVELRLRYPYLTYPDFHRRVLFSVG